MPNITCEVTTYAYDKNRNKSEQENSDGTKISYGYDVCNRLTSEIIRDKNGNLLAQYHYTYNGNGQKIRAEEKVKTPDGAFTTVKVSYEYDKANRLTGETTTTGKLTAAENEATETKTESIAYTYDEVGNRIKKLENGILTEYTYNELNQLVTETSQDEVCV